MAQPTLAAQGRRNGPATHLILAAQGRRNAPTSHPILATASQHCGQFACVRACRRVRPVYATVHAHQAAAPHTPIGRVRCDSRAHELTPRDEPVLRRAILTHDRLHVRPTARRAPATSAVSRFELTGFPAGPIPDRFARQPAIFRPSPPVGVKFTARGAV